MNTNSPKTMSGTKKTIELTKIRTSSQSTASTENDNENSKTYCNTCSKNFKENVECMSCDNCQNWFHFSCIGISKAEAKVVTRLEPKGIRFFCLVCNIANKTRSDFEESLTSINDKITQLARLEDKIEIMSEKIQEISIDFQTKTESETRSYADALTESIQIMKNHDSNITKATQNSCKILANQVDHAEQERRKCCAILHNLDERGVNTLADKLGELCNTLSYPPDLMSVSFRLGAKGKNETANKHRPVKIKFTDETKKWDFIKRLNRDKPQSMFATLDLSKEEREREFNLRQKICDLKKSNPTSIYCIKRGEIQNRHEGSWMSVM